MSIAWLFPPGKSGWMGLKDLSLGYDRSNPNIASPIKEALEEYLSAVKSLPGAEEVAAQDNWAYHFSPEATVSAKDDIIEILAKLVARISNAPTA